MITNFGYYTPFMLIGSVFMAVGVGLLSTLKVNSGHSAWIGYQIIYGLGVGFGMQQSLIAAQTVLPLQDIPIGTSIMNFCLTLGGSLFISVGQNIFTNRLLANLKSGVSGVSPELILTTGATSVKQAVTAIAPGSLSGVLVAYNGAVTQTFYVSVAMASLSIIGGLGMEWKSVKGKKLETVSA